MGYSPAMTLATIVTGEAGLADILFLVAFILFVIVAVMRFVARSTEGGLMAAGAAALALALLVL